MGGGDKLFAKIDTGIRAAKVIICCVTEKYAESPNCNREVTIQLSKRMTALTACRDDKNVYHCTGEFGNNSW